MNEPDTGREFDREMAALFSAAETPPESDEQFVDGSHEADPPPRADAVVGAGRQPP